MDVLLKNSFYETLNNVVDLNKDNKISRNDVDLEKIYITIWVIVKKLMRDIYKEYNEENKNEKRVYYISMEFLMGKMLKDSLINLGIEEDIKDLIEDFGYDIIDLYKFDVETKLGSGGLGRLGACYLDSFASLGILGGGYSLLYEAGLFKQNINNLKQEEEEEKWLNKGNLILDTNCEKVYNVNFYGEVRKECLDNKEFYNHYNFETEKVVGYDLYIKGYTSKEVSVLRLWKCVTDKEITKSLYPNDEKYDGKVLRLKQQYLLSSASVQDILNDYFKNHKNIHDIYKYNKIHINDTHPALCIPELIRILTDVYEVSFKEALDIAKNVFSYTNHTILQEALEKWPIEMIKKILPKIYIVIEMIDKENDIIKIIDGKYVHMARLCTYVSNKVNGVSNLHSEILKNNIFDLFYKRDKDKFTNVTNGVSHRRWLVNNNRLLCDYLKSIIGDEFIYDFRNIKKLIKFKDDEKVLDNIRTVKNENKVILKRYLKDRYNIDIDEKSRIDVHIKRFHEYKRQLLNVMKIVYLIMLIEEGEYYSDIKQTFIFAGKAAPNYKEAKDVIELILHISKYVKKEEINKYLDVVFIPNYDVELAEVLIPAADVSEQISLAGQEASGTGNMKFMMNGAITIGTLDGANVEIKEEVGSENIIIFGMEKEKVFKDIDKYHPNLMYFNFDVIKKVVDRISEGFGKRFDNIKKYLLTNDRFMCLADFEEYLNAYYKMDLLYKDEKNWNKMVLSNIASSGMFSSDRAILEYKKKIWK